MSTYSELQKQIGELQLKAEKARQDEIQGAVSEVNALIAKYNLSAKDLSFSGTKVVSAKRKGGVVAIKYRDGAGNTWTGRGRTPTWLANAESNGVARETMLVK